MTFEVQKPNEFINGMKDCGRIYICDLAGTEPAGDIVYGKYEKKVLPNGILDYLNDLTKNKSVLTSEPFLGSVKFEDNSIEWIINWLAPGEDSILKSHLREYSELFLYYKFDYKVFCLLKLPLLIH